jgi:predicted metalloprotease
MGDARMGPFYCPADRKICIDLGISRQVAPQRSRPDYRQHSVRLALQADYLAGVWANHNRGSPVAGSSVWNVGQAQPVRFRSRYEACR